MKCHRCGSIMAYERFYAPHDHFSGWRCILCGEIIDPVILQNRQTKMNSKSRGRGREGPDDHWVSEPDTDIVGIN